jgi:predicted phosphodiesterase
MPTKENRGVKTGTTSIARDYRTKYPDMPTKKLARIMYSENNLLFTNEEAARSALRYIEGKNGANHRLVKAVTSSEFFKVEDRARNPYNLPASDETAFEPYVIKGHKKVLILSDIHVPYHSIDAITAAIQYAKKTKPDALLLNGDTIDCHRLSRFIKDPKKRNFKLELDTFKALFDIFEKELKCKIYFKIGNHEERYEHFLYEKASELVGIEEFEFENIIKARARGIEIIGDKRPMKLNNLWGIHGHEYVGGISAPVNPARGLFLKAKVSTFQGHNHQTSEHTEPTLTGKMVTTWSLGCLSELHPAYMPLNKWNHGFAEVDLDSNGEDFEFNNKRIFKGKIV